MAVDDDNTEGEIDTLNFYQERANKKRSKSVESSTLGSNNASSSDGKRIKGSQSVVEEYVIDPDKIKKYRRGKKVRPSKVRDRKLRNDVQRDEKDFKDAVRQAARAELLLPEESGYLEAEEFEKTHRFKQKQIAAEVDITSAQKLFDLKMDTFGPYRMNYTRNGKFLLIGGNKGHIAALDWSSKKLKCEFHVKETVRDVKWLHQETMFAVAQKKHVYIYDNTGMELHCLKKHLDVNRLEFLPYHFLLATADRNGSLKYQDTSTGKFVSELRTKSGRCDCMTQNPYNAVINLGHYNGTVTMWSPTVKEPLVKMLCHRGPVIAAAVDRQGLYITTSGLDGRMKVWDVRTYKPLFVYGMYRAAQTLAISQKGLLAAGFGPHCYIYKDAFVEKQKMPYLKHLIPSQQIDSIQFCPYEDVLGIGHSNGFSSLLIPGAGEPNFDALEANPYQTKTQRKEHEVKMLLDKIQPELITLDPRDILKIDRGQSDATKEGEKPNEEVDEPFVPKFKTKGRSSTGKVLQRKKGQKLFSKREKLRQFMLAKKKEEQEKKALENSTTSSSSPKTALDRFKKTST